MAICFFPSNITLSEAIFPEQFVEKLNFYLGYRIYIFQFQDSQAT